MARSSLSGAAVLAAVLLVFGGVLLLGNLGFLGDSFTTGGFIRRFWPVPIICLGLWKFAADGFRLGWKSSTLVALGLTALFFNLGWWRPNIRLIFPLALVALGGLVIVTIRRAYRQN